MKPQIPGTSAKVLSAPMATPEVQNPSIAQAYLEFEDRREKILLKADLIRVGSNSDCNIVLNDPAVSRRQAIFRKMGSFWLVQDLGSTNGAWVKGARIDRPTRLNAGDRIAFGRARFVQCKRYNSSHKVSRPEIQAFHGRLAREPRARGIFITTSSFTRGAQKEAELTGINLIDGKELETLIIRHRIPGFPR